MKFTQFLVAALLALNAMLAHALDIQPYTAAALAQAQKAGQPVALHFHADWCPTCRAQTQVLQQLKTEHQLDMTVLVVNYDTEKDLKRQFKIRAQSTFIVLKGKTETMRLVGDTSDVTIRNALKTAL
ncbi:MAG: thioredoxin family protein [Rhodoferax sp.]|nr:thioredoxin family protein [Rhodoferax sp.]OIP21572.1 MAG: thiol reductase thioredoxin [Comamonadaceae bacterium CG2_30_60_41]PIW09562.1 MAG: thioredoxin [Comamonadaceae bacterium CG17_big_fil_post_rev_8_21_14_2_50_60_13]PIY26742.1 MAG: thioredoxin [Comamonadaceae bacterium CG_4_10_14_3_um_filter_60_75]PJC11837.1 MAG: thioredoxin [Comamonadaceae bacterium CG_4_9_14_0_8_um_filter_60_18]